MAGYLTVTSWAKYQHYKNRKPPWVKFYVELLDPENKINALPIATRFLFDRMLLLAAEYDNRVPNNPELLARLLRMPTRTVRDGLAELVQGRWLRETQTKRGASRGASTGASNVATEKRPQSKRQRESKSKRKPLPTETRSETTSDNGTAGGDYEPEHPENLPPELTALVETATKVMPS